MSDERGQGVLVVIDMLGAAVAERDQVIARLEAQVRALADQARAADDEKERR